MDIKKMLKPIISAATGLLGLIFLAINYLTVTVSFWGQTASSGIDNGYGFAFFSLSFDGAKASVFGYITSLALFVLFFASIALLLIGAAKILRELKVLQLPASIPLCKIESLASVVFQGTAVLAIVSILIFGFANGQDGVSYMPGAGAWLLLVLAVVSALAPKLIAKMNASAPAEAAPAEAAPAEEAAKEEEKTEE